MNVLILTVGTRGDVQPYVALALGLKDAGHSVTICTCRRFDGFVTGYGVGFRPMDEGLLELLESDFGRELFGNLHDVWGALKAVPKVMRRVGPIHRRMIADAWEAARDVRPDVILHHPKMFCSTHFAAVLDVPAILAVLYPTHVPTGEAPCFGFPRLPLGRGYNRLTYRAVHSLTKLGSRKFMREWRDAHDPAGRSRHSGPTRVTKTHGVPAVHGVSPHVCPVPDDWPDDAAMTGYWFLDSGRGGDALPAELATFLNDGPPPVYVGFGSMATTDAASLTERVLNAVRLADVRAVLASGWGGLSGSDLPPGVLMLDAAPHDVLFPRCAAVVHHGGAGTTAAGLRAGRPTVVCPFGMDQNYWARRVVDLGVGPPPVPQKRLTADHLAEAIRAAVSSDSIRRASAGLGEAIRDEDGVGTAVRAVERFAASGGVSELPHQ